MRHNHVRPQLFHPFDSNVPNVYNRRVLNLNDWYCKPELTDTDRLDIADNNRRYLELDLDNQSVDTQNPNNQFLRTEYQFEYDFNSLIYYNVNQNKR